MDLIRADQDLQLEALAFRDELRFVARHVGIALPAEKEKEVEDSHNVFSEVEALISLLTSNVVGGAGTGSGEDIKVGTKRTRGGKTTTSGSSSVVPSEDSSCIVTISASGTVFAVSRATLLHAPEGSLLRMMLSDEWGHSLDRDGHIVQKVNPHHFEPIVNYLRLKALLKTDTPPSIVVYSQDRPALSNLLAFYGMSEVPVRCI
jgi:hypothetical protein